VKDGKYRPKEKKIEVLCTEACNSLSEVAYVIVWSDIPVDRNDMLLKSSLIQPCGR